MSHCLPFLHEKYYAQEDDDKEQDACNDAGDLHRVVGLLLRLHRIRLVCCRPYEP